MSDTGTQETIERVLPPPEPQPSILTANPDRFGYKQTASDYGATFRLDARFMRMSKQPEEPIIKVKINFEHIRVAIQNTLITSYTEWTELREAISADSNLIDNFIEEGCRALSISAIYSLYNHLAIVTQTHAPTLADQYRTRCPQSKYKQLPSGIVSLVQQFGITDSIETFGNCRFIHYWDNANSATFGIDPAVNLDNNKLNGMIHILSKVGTELVSVPSRAPLRTPWDSLIIETTNGAAYTATTTYPIHEYNLNTDIFLAIKFRTSATYEACIQEYSPRIARFPENFVTDITVDDSTTVATTAGNKKRKAASNTLSFQRTNATRPCNHFQTVTYDGLQFEDISDNDEHPKIYVYGRGNQANAMGIKTVARGVTPDEVDTFFTHLFRTKM